MTTATQSPLGKKSSYIAQYQRDLLFPIARNIQRNEIQVPATLPFIGVDIWNGYEISWLNAKGKPIVAIAEFIFPCHSPHLIESKSFKLYLNSFNNTPFSSIADVRKIMQQDLSDYAGADVTVNLIALESYSEKKLSDFEGICLDTLDITCDTYIVEPSLLTTIDTPSIVTETVYSDLLKSNCLVTGQPDWGSVQIHYRGKPIQHEGLLRYIVSFRNHNEFHEQCVERIFMDIMQRCAPEMLTVYARYTRRGGLDINPFRSTEAMLPSETARQVRQ